MIVGSIFTPAQILIKKTFVLRLSVCGIFVVPSFYSTGENLSLRFFLYIVVLSILFHRTLYSDMERNRTVYSMHHHHYSPYVPPSGAFFLHFDIFYSNSASFADCQSAVAIAYHQVKLKKFGPYTNLN